MANDRRDFNLDYITPAQAADGLPSGRSGRPVHAATVIRWITEGTEAPSGQVVRLRAIRMGGRWLTTREWLDDYARQLTLAFEDARAMQGRTEDSSADSRMACVS